MLPAFKVLATGMSATVQDRGQRGWRKFGVPPGGAMDEHAADWANRLVGNAPEAAVLELLWGGAKLEAADDVWVAVTGAPARTSIPLWHAVHVKARQVLEFSPGTSGVWIYLAVAG